MNMKYLTHCTSVTWYKHTIYIYIAYRFPVNMCHWPQCRSQDWLIVAAILCWSQAVPYSRDYKQKYDYFRKKLKKPVSNCNWDCLLCARFDKTNEDWCCLYLWYQFLLIFCVCSALEMMINLLLNELDTLLYRLTSQTVLRWRWDEMRSWRTHTDASSQLRRPTCWRHDCGWSLKERKDWTMVAWPGSGSSSCLRKCSTRTTACSSILPRESV